MTGAFLAATLSTLTGSFWLGLGGAIAGTALLGVLLEVTLLRRLYRRDHLTQVLATFALILIFNELARMIWGAQPPALNVPESLAGPVELLPGFFYPAYRLLIIAAGLAVAAGLYLFISRTRAGMWVRAGSANRDMALAMGVNVPRMFTLVFAAGAGLAALAGALLGPLLAVQVGMGENILILAFVVIVVGGIGSVRGAFVAALLVGIVDTAGRSLLPMLLRQMLPPATASSVGPALASILIYLLMALVLFRRPQGLFAARS
jgi:branched-chain amino acid transport system permease protein